MQQQIRQTNKKTPKQIGLKNYIKNSAHDDIHVQCICYRLGGGC